MTDAWYKIESCTHVCHTRWTTTNRYKLDKVYSHKQSMCVIQKSNLVFPDHTNRFNYKNFPNYITFEIEQ